MPPGSATPSGSAVPSAGSAMPASTRLVWAAAGWAAGIILSFAVAVAAILFVVDRDSSGASLLESMSIGGLVLLQVPLWLGLVGTPLLARRYGLGWRHQMAWRMRAVDIPVGIGIGLGMQLVAVPLLYWPIFKLFGELDVGRPAQQLADQAVTSLDVVLLLVMTVVMAPVTEEVFFRGLLQGALQDRLGTVSAVAVASAVFAVTHFQGIQMPALLLVGAVHGILVVRTGRLGPALWSHASFNAVTTVILVLS